MAVLLFTSPNRVVLNGPAAARLVAIGVTHATVVHDEGAVALVLEGWRFDAARDGARAAEAVGGPDGRCRILRQQDETSVLPEAWAGAGGKEEG